MTRLPVCERCGKNPVGYPARACCYFCVPRQRRAMQFCERCGENPVAYTGRACCYSCVPRNRKALLVCKRCGSDNDHYSRGLCRQCHRYAHVVDSCRDCLAWGVTRREKWLCQACRGWHRNYDNELECPSCHRQVLVNERGFCRMCTRHASIINQRNPTHRALDIVGLGRHGHQLAIADLILKKRRSAPTTPHRQRVRWPHQFPTGYEQLVLFSWPRQLTTTTAATLAPPPIPRLEEALRHAVHTHGNEHGWGTDIRDRCMRSIRILLSIQDTPGAAITTTDTKQIAHLRGASVRPAQEVLASVGMLIDTEPPVLETWFEQQVVNLADPMRSELREWFHTLRDGSASTPRRRPRQPGTVRNYVSAVITTAHHWTDQGRRSLREITRDDIIEAVASERSNAVTLTAMRSLFGLLKARKTTFVDPTIRLRHDPPNRERALPLADLTPVIDALNSDDPARCALTALAAFHALRTSQLRQIQLVDIRDGRLHVDDHTMLLADPVNVHVGRWLQHRAQQWPNTINPHLFIHSRTAPRTNPATTDWVLAKIGMSPQKIRADRILHEVIATGGDARRLCDLFGISIQTAQRYVDTIARSDEKPFSAPGS